MMENGTPVRFLNTMIRDLPKRWLSGTIKYLLTSDPRVPTTYMVEFPEATRPIPVRHERLEPMVPTDDVWVCTAGGPEGNGCGMRFTRPTSMPAEQCMIEWCPHCGYQYGG